MIKVLVFFVLGAATLYFIIRALVNTEPGKLSRVIKIVIFGVKIITNKKTANINRTSLITFDNKRK